MHTILIIDTNAFTTYGSFFLKKKKKDLKNMPHTVKNKKTVDPKCCGFEFLLRAMHCFKCFGSERWCRWPGSHSSPAGKEGSGCKQSDCRAHAPSHCPLFPGKRWSWVTGLHHLSPWHPHSVQQLCPSFLSGNPVLAGGPAPSSRVCKA